VQEAEVQKPDEPHAVKEPDEFDEDDDEPPG